MLGIVPIVLAVAGQRASRGTRLSPDHLVICVFVRRHRGSAVEGATAKEVARPVGHSAAAAVADHQTWVDLFTRCCPDLDQLADVYLGGQSRPRA